MLETSNITGLKVDAITKDLLKSKQGRTFDLNKLIDDSMNKKGSARIIKPIEPDEMWAEGFGNRLILTEDQIRESSDDSLIPFQNPNISTLLYKGSNNRLVGPYENIGVRSDTEKTISEGEIIFIIYKGKFVGISVGNEVAGNLRAQSQFWVSPSKVFKGCAAIGPCILSMEDEEENSMPIRLKLEINQYRNNKLIAEGSIISDFKLSPNDIVSATTAHDSPPDLVIQYSGGFAIARKDGDIIPLEAVSIHI